MEMLKVPKLLLFVVLLLGGNLLAGQTPQQSSGVFAADVQLHPNQGGDLPPHGYGGITGTWDHWSRRSLRP